MRAIIFIFILIYLILTFISGGLYYIYQDKIKELIDENDCLEESPVESLFIGLIWPLLIPGTLIIYLFKKWINFLEKLKKDIDK